jgi:DNA-binding CsgD family transcriptional regulator
MKAGAFDYLLKPIASQAASQTIQQALEHSWLQLRGLAQMRVLKERFELLSRREREVMDLVVSGRLNKQVGFELGISEITVKAHRGKLMRKMRARSFAELVNMAVSLGRPAARDLRMDFAALDSQNGRISARTGGSYVRSDARTLVSSGATTAARTAARTRC